MTKRYVMWNDSNGDLSKAMRLPRILTAEDGREFEIIEWMPRIAVGESVTVLLKVNVNIECEEDKIEGIKCESDKVCR